MDSKTKNFSEFFYKALEVSVTWLFLLIVGVAMSLAIYLVVTGYNPPETIKGSNGVNYTTFSINVPTNSGTLECVGVEGSGFQALNCK